jgi:hypothetical protein
LGLSDSRPRDSRSRSRQDGSGCLAAPGSPERWLELQQLRRGQRPVAPLLEGLARGALSGEADLLAALWSRLTRPQVELLLAAPVALEPEVLLQGIGPELPALADDPAVREAWLEPLLSRCDEAAIAWVRLLGHFRDGRVALRLRRRIAAGLDRGPASDAELAPLLVLLGQQRCAEDGELLLQLVLQPGPLALRRAALEGLAVGLSAWPLEPLAAGLRQLAGDLDRGLAAVAVDLLSRLPDGQRQLRGLRRDRLDPEVAARLQRRLRRAPLVLVVHGRQGGLIPPVLQSLASELERRRRAPVLLQALTAEPPEAGPALRLAAATAGVITLVPLLLLPGEHVRRDLPALAEAWRLRLAAGPLVQGAPLVRRRPFLGAWPAWQRLLAQLLDQAAGEARPLTWLHHPLQGELGARYLRHLGVVLGRPGLPVAYQSEPQALRSLGDAATVLAPLTLAPNRLSESLSMSGHTPPAQVLPPLLDLPAVRDFLLAQLEALP